MAVNLDKLRMMTDEQLRALNEGVCQVFRERQADRARSQMATFRRGEKAQFWSSKKGRMVTVRIDKFNQKTVSATELNADGQPTVMTWRIAPSLLRACH